MKSQMPVLSIPLLGATNSRDVSADRSRARSKGCGLLLRVGTIAAVLDSLFPNTYLAFGGEGLLARTTAFQRIQHDVYTDVQRPNDQDVLFGTRSFRRLSAGCDVLNHTSPE